MPKGENFFFLSLVRDKSLSPLNPHTPVLDSRPRTTPARPHPLPHAYCPSTHTHTHRTARPHSQPPARPHTRTRTRTHTLSLSNHACLSQFFFGGTRTPPRHAHAAHTPRTHHAHQKQGGETPPGQKEGGAGKGEAQRRGGGQRRPRAPRRARSLPSLPSSEKTRSRPKAKGSLTRILRNTAPRRHFQLIRTSACAGRWRSSRTRTRGWPA